MFELIGNEQNEPNIFVIFGGTGDLTKRKLLPAVYSLISERRLSDSFVLVIVGRQEKTDEQFRDEVYDSINRFSRVKVENTVWEQLRGRIYYEKLDFADDSEGYVKLNNRLQAFDIQYETVGNRLFYLAVAPKFFELITRHLYGAGMLNHEESWQRILIEKPFGTDLVSAKELNDNLYKLIAEDKIFRIDHYLGKEMIQNILAVRFGNSLFEPLWNHHYIDNIQITSSETLGIENRGGYYEGAGILKDMLQNHLLQMLAIIAMEPPVSLEPERIRDEKVKVLRCLRPFDENSASEDVVFGQYGSGTVGGREVLGYRQEDKVSPDSDTDTFVALKTYIDNFRWGGVPFYIRSGKRMKKKVTEIVIQFKKLPGVNFYNDYRDNEPNLLVIQIQPREGFFFQVNAKKPDSEFIMEQVQMDYCQSCRVENNSPEAYERIILEAIKNNTSLFSRWDELESSWRYIESIDQYHRKQQYPNYTAGSSGPQEANELVRKDGRVWWEI